MMEKEHKGHEHHDHGGNFSSGFLLGVVVGAILVFLLVTKKGKKILNVLTENGIEGLSELTDFFDDEEELEEEEAYTSEKSTSRPTKTQKTEPILVAQEEIEEMPVKSHPIKRFFKRKK